MLLILIIAGIFALSPWWYFETFAQPVGATARPDALISIGCAKVSDSESGLGGCLAVVGMPGHQQILPFIYCGHGWPENIGTIEKATGLAYRKHSTFYGSMVLYQLVDASNRLKRFGPCLRASLVKVNSRTHLRQMKENQRLMQALSGNERSIPAELDFF